MRHKSISFLGAQAACLQIFKSLLGVLQDIAGFTPSFLLTRLLPTVKQS